MTKYIEAGIFYFLIAVVLAIPLVSAESNSYHRKSEEECRKIVDKKANSKFLMNATICDACSMECISALKDLKHELGCCMNVFQVFMHFLNNCKMSLNCPENQDDQGVSAASTLHQQQDKLLATSLCSPIIYQFLAINYHQFSM